MLYFHRGEKCMKFLDLFSGVGGFTLGLTKAGHECVGYCEIDTHAVKSYQAIHKPSPNEKFFSNVKEISKADAEQFKGKVDIITAGFPCFVAGTQITTKEGIKNIEDVETGDLVLTHNNRFKPVVIPMAKYKKGIYHLNVKGSPMTKVTEEHPFYVRKLSMAWITELNAYVKTWSEPEWVNAKDLIPNVHYVGFAENKTSINPYNITEEYAYLLGSVPEREELPSTILELPSTVLKHFIDGVLTVNGSLDNGEYVVTSKSKKMIYSLGQAVQKVYNAPYLIEHEDDYTLTFRKDGKNETDSVYLEGMLWNPVKSLEFDESWEGVVYNFEVADDNSYVANNMAVHNCQSFSVGGKKLGMKDDRGVLFLDVVRLTDIIQPKYFILENVVGLLSNISEMDKEAGISELEKSVTTFNQSGLKRLTKKSHDIFIDNLSFYAENYLHESKVIDDFIEKPFVQEKLRKGVEKFSVRTFNIIVHEFSKIGYDIEWRIFDSTEFGVAQKRKRVYIVGHRRGESSKPILHTIGESAEIVDFRRSKENQTWENENVDVIPIMNPVFTKRTANGRIFKEPFENMFTITKTGVHGYLLVSKDPFENGEQGPFSDKLHKMFDLSPYNDAKGLYYTIRKYTPLESWRTMGYEDEQVLAAKEVVSEAELYKQSGNSITPQIPYNIGRLLN